MLLKGVKRKGKHWLRLYRCIKSGTTFFASLFFICLALSAICGDSMSCIDCCCQCSLMEHIPSLSLASFHWCSDNDQHPSADMAFNFQHCCLYFSSKVSLYLSTISIFSGSQFWHANDHDMECSDKSLLCKDIHTSHVHICLWRGLLSDRGCQAELLNDRVEAITYCVRLQNADASLWGKGWGRWMQAHRHTGTQAHKAANVPMNHMCRLDWFWYRSERKMIK